MGDVVNLRLARKAHERAQAQAQAAANRAKFGRTKADRTREAMDAARAERHLDGAKRSDDAHDL